MAHVRPDPKTAGILGVCTQAKKSPQECTWLFSAEGKAEFPNGAQEIDARARKWMTWRENLPFTKQLVLLRNQYVGHRGLKAVLGKAVAVSIKWSEISSALEGTDTFVNEFKKLIENSSIYHQNIYDEVIRDGSFVIAAAETHVELSIEDPIMCERSNNLAVIIERADKDQKASNGWSL